MEKKLLVVLVVVGLCSTVALALDPMGPPAAGLKQGQWSAGIDYSYTEMNLKAVNGKANMYAPYGLQSMDVKDVKVHKVYGNIGYGISDKWEAFVRVGGAFNGEGEGTFYYKGTVDCGNDWAFGLGTKATLYQASPELKWGGLAQVSWTAPDGTLKIPDYTSEKVDVTIELIEYQLALGPTWTPSKGFSIYGGPFLHYVDGELKGGKYGYEGSYDFEQQTTFGGYIGAQVELDTNAAVNVEWIHTDDADAVGVQGVWRL